MVAKMPRSISFLMTRAALTSSFSESSLTVMPSEMVISRLMGGGPASTWRRVRAQDLLFLDALARLAALGRLSPGRPRGCSTGGGASPGPMRAAATWDAAGAADRRGVRRAGAPGRTPGRGHHRLAGTNGTAINRLAGNGRAGRLGNSGTRGRGLSRHSGTRRAELGHQIGDAAGLRDEPPAGRPAAVRREFAGPEAWRTGQRAPLANWPAPAAAEPRGAERQGQPGVPMDAAGRGLCRMEKAGADRKESGPVWAQVRRARRAAAWQAQAWRAQRPAAGRAAMSGRGRHGRWSPAKRGAGIADPGRRSADG